MCGVVYFYRELIEMLSLKFRKVISLEYSTESLIKLVLCNSITYLCNTIQ